MFEGFSDDAKAAVAAAHASAERLGWADTNSGHLLIGIVSVPSAAARVLAGVGITLDGVEAALLRRARRPAERHIERWSPECLSLFAACLSNRIKRGDPTIGIEHLAVGIAHERHTHAAGILTELSGGTPDALRALLMARLGFESWNDREPSGGPTKADRLRGGGLEDPLQVALQGFAPEAGAYVAAVSYPESDHAVVKVGFPDKSAFYFLSIFRHDDGWRRDMPFGRDAWRPE